jgi:hypothetical protein
MALLRQLILPMAVALGLRAAKKTGAATLSLLATVDNGVSPISINH